MKKTYYKILDIDADEWWVCSPRDFENGIKEWVDNSHQGVTVTQIEMTEEEFNKLPEL